MSSSVEVHQAFEGWQVVSHIGEDGQIIDAGYRLHPGIDQAGHLKPFCDKAHGKSSG